MTCNIHGQVTFAHAESVVVDAILLHFGSEDRAEAERWFRDQPVPAYGMKTLKDVAKEFGAGEAISYLDCLKYGVA